MIHPKASKLNGAGRAGFTLIEVVVAVALFTLISYGLITLVSRIFTLSSKDRSAISDSDQARKLVFKIITQIRNATTGNNGAYPIDTAAAQQLIFYSNADTDPSIERIRYFLQNGSLYEGVTEFNGSTYNTSTETTWVVQNDIANNSTTPLFYYYDGTYTGSSSQSSLAQPVNVTQVKFIKLNMQIYNKAGLTGTSYYTVTGSGAIRNLKSNLGS